MEISPIAGIRAMPVMKAPPADPELTAVFDIENSPRIADETWTPSYKRSGRGSDEDGTEEEAEELDDFPDFEAEPHAATPVTEQSAESRIGFFA